MGLENFSFWQKLSFFGVLNSSYRFLCILNKFFKKKILMLKTILMFIFSLDQISDWFDSLAECVHWNVRKKQKHLDELTDLSGGQAEEGR